MKLLFEKYFGYVMIFGFFVCIAIGIIVNIPEVSLLVKILYSIACLIGFSLAAFFVSRTISPKGD